jgi:hypothetical protein
MPTFCPMPRFRPLTARLLGALLLVAAMMPFWSALGDGGSESPQSPPAKVSFNEHIRPLFAKHCVACHGGVKQASGVSLIYRDKALAEGDSGMPAIVPGDVAASYLVERISETDDDLRMPPAEHGPALSSNEIALVKQWITEGANWEEHWSFVAPHLHLLPESKQTWGHGRVDPFVLARMESHGLSPSPPASKSEWLRRVTFDLTGMPPTAKERAEFLADASPEAYERVVDRLLASSRYGEHWAAMWLDLARYADTMGYEKDPHRDIWPYRDWLIRALNADVPYNQFVIKQLAGDLIPECTMDDRIAAAFHANTQTNTEGGTDDEEFRTATVLDRVNTTWQVFGGLTYGCTQCHSHPYDPIEHQEYYEFAAVFNSTRDQDLDEETPKLRVPLSRDDDARANALDRRIAELRRALHAEEMKVAGDNQQWQSLTPDVATSTGQTKLAVQKDADTGLVEYVTVGTVTIGSLYTLEAPLPEGMSELTAIRLDALPKDVQAAMKIPELGFAVTRLRAWIITPGSETPEEVMFRLAMCDEAEPVLEPSDSLVDNNDGWASFSKIDRPRWAVFVPLERLKVAAGSRLRLELKQSRAATGAHPTVINRGRMAVSSDARWSELVANAEFEKLEGDLAKARAERDAIPAISIPVIAELDDEFRRHSYVFDRGNWLIKTDEVGPGVPAVFPEIPEGTKVDRLAVAEWFASAEHPLTSRVQVNRVWEQLFGRGIVETSGDFGTSGILPTHPELLDDLSARFATEMNWSTKALLREIVLSDTYRQTSRASAELIDADRDNRWLARGPRLRLTAEMVRDQALVLGGNYVDKMFGPPVMPPQPDGIWRSAYNGARWVNAEGDDRYRRAIYTYWKRTSPYPAMMMFDAPSREVCSVRRIQTNTPLQPLVTMNDPAFVECAQAFAARMASEGGATTNEQVAWALEQASCDEPTERAIAVLVSLHDDALAQFDASDAEMLKLGENAESYARTIVASAILNLDDVMTR